MDGVYVLHFVPPYRHARHYVGWAADIDRRVQQHRAGIGGSPLVNAALAAGCRIDVAATFVGQSRTDERRLKRTHNVPRYCPLCP